MRKIKQIIIHCSDSEFGDVRLIDRWHREKDWKMVGYHYVICNQFPKKTGDTVSQSDGTISIGRPIGMIGAHCEGENENSIGICLIGKTTFTDSQMASLKKLCLELMMRYSLTPENIYGHYETESGKKKGKTCPNFDVALLRQELVSNG